MAVTLGGIAHTSYPYGLAVDRNGLMWNSNLGSGSSWLAMDTTSTDPAQNKFVKAVPIAGRTSYGVAIDQTNNIYYATWGAAFGGIWRVDTATLAVTQISGGSATNTRGLTLDVAGDLYATEWTTPGCIAKFKGGTGAYLGRFCSNSLNYTVGIAGDTYGKIWATGYSSNNVIRFKPDFTLDAGFPVALPGTTYYNYSDWNGMILKTVTANNAQAGTWTKVFDSGSVNTQWATATWLAVTPPKTSVAVYFKAGNVPADFANQKSCGPFYTSPVDLTACNYGKKQLMQVIVYLNTTDVNVQPTMSNLQVFYP